MPKRAKHDRNGYRPRGVDQAWLDADNRLRATVRAWLRKNYPDLPDPPGKGWLIGATRWKHPKLDIPMLRVVVPGVDVGKIHYCPFHDQVCTAEEGDDEGYP